MTTRRRASRLDEALAERLVAAGAMGTGRPDMTDDEDLDPLVTLAGALGALDMPALARTDRLSIGAQLEADFARLHPGPATPPARPSGARRPGAAGSLAGAVILVIGLGWAASSGGSGDPRPAWPAAYPRMTQVSQEIDRGPIVMIPVRPPIGAGAELPFTGIPATAVVIPATPAVGAGVEERRWTVGPQREAATAAPAPTRTETQTVIAEVVATSAPSFDQPAATGTLPDLGQQPLAAMATRRRQPFPVALPVPVHSSATPTLLPTSPPAANEAPPMPLSPTARQLPYALRATWELSLAGPDRSALQDFEPLDVALDAAGRTYVADGRHNVVRLYDAVGTLEAIWHSPQVPALAERYLVPTALSVDQSSGDVAVLWRVYGALAPAGASGFIDIRRRDGTPRITWSTSATADIAFDGQSGNLFLASYGLIRRVDPVSRANLGETYTQCPLAASGLLDVTTDGRAVYRNSFTGGVVVAADDRFGQVVLNLAGATAQALAVDRADVIHVLVSGAGKGRPADAPLILSFDTAGRLLRTLRVGELAAVPVPASRWPWTIAVSTAGLALTTGDSAFQVHRFDAAMAPRWSLAGGRLRPEFSYRPVDNRKTSGIPMVALDDGSVLVLDNPAQRLITLDDAGLVRASEGLPGPATDLAADATAAFVSFPDGTVWQRGPGVGSIGPWIGDCDCHLGGRLALTADTLFASQQRGRRLGGFDRATGVLHKILAPADSPALWPADAASLPGGLLATADVASGQVQLWTAGLDAGPAWSPGGMLGPARVAGGRLADGTPVVATLTVDGLVELRDTTGTLVAAWRPGDDGTMVLAPDDIAMDQRGRVYVSDAVRQAVLVYEPADVTLPSPTPGAIPPPTCTLSGNKVAVPGQVRLGDTAVVTLTLRADCPTSASDPADIMLVVDRSGSMGGPLDTVVATARGFVSMLDSRRHRVGLVSFASLATLDAPLTNDLAVVIDALARITCCDEADTDIASALAMSDCVLSEDGRPEVQPIVVLLTDGQPTFGNPLSVAQAMVSRGIRLFTIGLGEDTDPVLLRAMAGDPSRYFHATTPSDLGGVYTKILRQISGIRLLDVQIDDRMGPGIDYLPGSASPSAIEFTDSLVWRLDSLPRAGITLTYRIRPHSSGWLDVNERAVASVAESSGAVGQFIFPVPRIEVVAPTPSRTPTPTATVLPTRQLAPAFLPLLLRESCTPQQRRSDVALVIDASSSMLAPTPAGRTKLAAAIAAARAFLDQLHLAAGDRAAVITFSGDATTLSPLTADRARLDAALDRITTAHQTRLDLGIAAGRAELSGPERQPRNTPVMIVLTDGRANPVPAEVAVAEAGQAKSLGILIFTIGLGIDLDTAALRDIASRPTWYYAAPDAESLMDIYRAIAGTIPCSARGFWARR